VITKEKINETIKLQKAIYNGLEETEKDYPYRDELIPLMKESCLVAIKALEKQKELLEYEYCDVCEWFEDYDWEENDISSYNFVANVKDFIID
jgi:hypothetical protein